MICVKVKILLYVVIELSLEETQGWKKEMEVPPCGCMALQTSQLAVYKHVYLIILISSSLNQIWRNFLKVFL